MRSSYPRTSSHSNYQNGDCVTGGVAPGPSLAMKMWRQVISKLTPLYNPTMTSLAFHQNNKFLIGELAQSLLVAFPLSGKILSHFSFFVCAGQGRAAYGKVKTECPSSDLSC